MPSKLINHKARPFLKKRLITSKFSRVIVYFLMSNLNIEEKHYIAEKEINCLKCTVCCYFTLYCQRGPKAERQAGVKIHHWVQLHKILKSIVFYGNLWNTMTCIYDQMLLCMFQWISYWRTLLQVWAYKSAMAICICDAFTCFLLLIWNISCNCTMLK